MHHTKRIALYSGASIALIVAIVFLISFSRRTEVVPLTPNTGTAIAPFIYSFNTATSTLYEAGSMQESTSPYWFLNSGALLHIAGGVGATAQGVLPLTNKWRLLYATMNPVDTDAGAHPQNTFRLVSKSSWDNVQLTGAFYIVKNNLSISPNRNASNGLLFMSRYKNSQTLYYAGIRVDGAAVIKKKYNGTYYTMAYKKVFSGTYDRSASPNLLPHETWLGLRSETETRADGSVSVRLSMQEMNGSWKVLLEAIDDGKKYGGTPAITGSSYIGVRTDFMDVLFDNFRAESL